MADEIMRDIFIKDRWLPVQIDYVQGTNAVPLKFQFRDYAIPSGAAARIRDGTAHNPDVCGSRGAGRTAAADLRPEDPCDVPDPVPGGTEPDLGIGGGEYG